VREHVGDVSALMVPVDVSRTTCVGDVYESVDDPPHEQRTVESPAPMTDHFQLLVDTGLSPNHQLTNLPTYQLTNLPTDQLTN
jgi:hypothetical protein